MKPLLTGLPEFGPGREFERILSVLRGGPHAGRRGAGRTHALLGPGDDAAVLADGTVISTDLGIEGIHFRLEWISAREAGYRTAASGLSDMAAMGAEPTGVLASAAAPGDGRGVEDLMAGVNDLLSEIGVELLGGDLARSPGPMILDIVSVGRTERPVCRSGAHVGDDLWVTGVLGGAAAAAVLWTAGERVPPALRSAFARPCPRVDEGRWLAHVGVTAGIDLSDGLASDAAHLAAASGARAVLEAGTVPLDPALGRVELPGGMQAIDLAIGGGDDYELLVASPPGRLAERREEFEGRFGLSLTRVGRIAEGSGVFLEFGDARAVRPLAGQGFDHFRRARP